MFGTDRWTVLAVRERVAEFLLKVADTGAFGRARDDRVASEVRDDVALRVEVAGDVALVQDREDGASGVIAGGSTARCSAGTLRSFSRSSSRLVVTFSRMVSASSLASTTRRTTSASWRRRASSGTTTPASAEGRRRTRLYP
ncbi:MAG: hypothetical protein U5P41_04965 [Gammaproteobacteria bacterium]|nr:hypothetical protein [Gammaproteobacteria bacterium]